MNDRDDETNRHKIMSALNLGLIDPQTAVKMLVRDRHEQERQVAAYPSMSPAQAGTLPRARDGGIICLPLSPQEFDNAG